MNQLFDHSLSKTLTLLLVLYVNWDGNHHTMTKYDMNFYIYGHKFNVLNIRFENVEDIYKN